MVVKIEKIDSIYHCFIMRTDGRILHKKGKTRQELDKVVQNERRRDSRVVGLV